MNNIISLVNASIYQGGQPILKNVSFSVSNGDFIYLIGRTGAGKSSLLKSLYGDLKIEADKAEIVGFDLSKLNQKQIPFLRRKLGIIFQDFQLFQDRNAFENLAFVLKATGVEDESQISNRVKDALLLTGLNGKEKKRPFELSGGEQQRLVLARAIINKPEVILADEPTGNLDPTVADLVVGLLQDISSQGTAVIMATHDYRMLKKFPGKMYRCEDNQFMTIEVAPEFP